MGKIDKFFLKHDGEKRGRRANFHHMEKELTWLEICT